MGQQPPPIWQTKPYVGLLCDAYVESTELEGGGPAGAYSVLSYLLSRSMGAAVPNQASENWRAAGIDAPWRAGEGERVA